MTALQYGSCHQISWSLWNMGPVTRFHDPFEIWVLSPDFTNPLKYGSCHQISWALCNMGPVTRFQDCFAIWVCNLVHYATYMVLNHIQWQKGRIEVNRNHGSSTSIMYAGMLINHFYLLIESTSCKIFYTVFKQPKIKDPNVVIVF